MQTLGPIEILSGLIGVVFFAIQVGVVVVALVYWKEARAHLRAGAILTGAALVLGMPMTIASIMYLDPGAAIMGDSQALAPIVRVITQIAMVGGVVLHAFLLIMQPPVAMRFGAPHPFPALYQEPERGLGIPLAVVGGVALGTASTIVFFALGVDEGAVFKTVEQLMPGLNLRSPHFILGVSLPATLGMAVSEEILFRGVVQRWLTRTLGRTTAGAWLAISLVSALWALGHLPNTDQPLLKLLQVFILGLFFGYLSWRHSVEASIAAHAGLNASTILFAVGAMSSGPYPG